MTTRLIAFYLPQYHPVPENDSWWGKGFTEWTNVTRARPRFPDHYQPHLPADLGFYDLRVPEVREEQAALAREYGLSAFCYYHYWFNGRRILERPFNEVLASGRPDFPFCLCWANENWTRRWDGSDREILLEQRHSEGDDREHLRWLARAFRDPRYIRVQNRPLFLVYRADVLPDAAATVTRWRDEARRLGVGELYLANVESFPGGHGLAPKAGFDAAVEFAPDWRLLPVPIRQEGWRQVLSRLGLGNSNLARPGTFDYDQFVANMLAKPRPEYRRFPCVTPSWDNTARRKEGATILHGATPEKYGRWLQQVIQSLPRPTSDERIVFVNAWNEWAEGNHLEPCQKWGRRYLEATRAALTKS